MGSTNHVSGVELDVCSRGNVSSQLLEWLFYFIEKPYVSPVRTGTWCSRLMAQKRAVCTWVG